MSHDTIDLADTSDLSAQGKAAKMTYLLLITALAGPGDRSLSMQELSASVGIRSHQGFYRIIDNLSQAGVPIYSVAPGRWTLNLDALPPRLRRGGDVLHDVQPLDFDDEDMPSGAARGVPELD